MQLTQHFCGLKSNRICSRGTKKKTVVSLLNNSFSKRQQAKFSFLREELFQATHTKKETFNEEKLENIKVYLLP